MASLLDRQLSDPCGKEGTVRQLSTETYSELKHVFERLQCVQTMTSEPDMHRGTSSPQSLSDQQFLQWQSLLEERTGMFINIYHRSLLESNLIIRMREIDCADFAEYYEKVCSKPDGIVEWNILLDRVMVQETRFYRNPESLMLF